MDITERIKMLRENHGISQAKLAQKIGVSPGNIGDWERGKTKPGADALVLLAGYFNVSTDWLLTGKVFIGDENSSSSNLTDSEKQCLAQFNQLTYEQQIRILERMSVYIEEYNKKAILSDYQNGEEAAADETA